MDADPVLLRTGDLSETLIKQVRKMWRQTGELKTATGEDVWEEAISWTLSRQLHGFRPGLYLPASASEVLLDCITIDDLEHRGRALMHLHESLGCNEHYPDFMQEVLGAVALWYLDLPASEAHHHSGRYGMIDHAIEVCLRAIMLFHRYWCDERRDPERDFKIRTGLAAIGAGLLHDCGKLIDIEVRDPATQDVWDPLTEPLAFFKRRHNLRLLEPTVHRFRPGRGLNGHEKKGRKLASVILPGCGGAMNRGWILGSLDAYFSRYEQPQPAFPRPFGQVANFIHEADGASVAGWKRNSANPEGYLKELLNEYAEDVEQL
jgi:hypothetical protein